MSDEGDPSEPSAITKVARDLTEIITLAPACREQAVAKANNPEYLPGGAATVELSPVANLEAWEFIYETAEAWNRDPTHRTRRHVEHVADEDDANEPSVQLVKFWAERWRVIHNREIDSPETLDSAVGFIRQLLDWAYENEPQWDQFARDMNRARVNLENILYAGRRVERTRVPCNNPQCDRHPRLIKLHGATAAQDRYKCPGCKKRFDQGDYEDAYAAQLRSEGAAKFMPLRDAIATLKLHGSSERNVRRWLAPYEKHASDVCPRGCGEWRPNRVMVCPSCGAGVVPRFDRRPEDVVLGYCDVATRKVFVWWPDLWTRHNNRRKRRKRTQSA